MSTCTCAFPCGGTELDELRKDVERLQTRIEVIRQLYPGSPSDTELDIAIDAAIDADLNQQTTEVKL